MVIVLISSIAIAFCVNLLATPLILHLAHRNGWLDRPNHRSVHVEPVPRLGGVGIFAAFALTCIGFFVWDLTTDWSMPPAAYNTGSLWVGLGLLSTFVLGILDDFVQFRALYKFLLQLLGALAALAAGLYVETITIPIVNVPLALGPFGPLLTVLWIVGVTNSVNLIDGMDGLAGSFSLLAFTFLGVAMGLTEHWFAALCCFLLVGAVAGFLVFNFPPARIFMGDAGSLSLGYVLAVLPLWGGPTNSLFHQLWLLPFTIVLIPVGDTVAAMLRRTRRRVPIWSPDKEHTHHKLLRLGFSAKQILALMCAVFVVTSSPVVAQAVAVANGWRTDWLSAVCVASMLVALGLFWVLHVFFRRRFPDSEYQTRK